MRNDLLFLKLMILAHLQNTCLCIAKKMFNIYIKLCLSQFSDYKVDAYSNVKRWLDVVSKEIPTFNEVNVQAFQSLRKLYEIVRSNR